MTTAPLGDPDDARLIAELRSSLAMTQRQLARQKARTDELVDATIESCRAAILAHKPDRLPAAPPATDKRGKPEVALWDTGDWQFSKVTTSYNSKIARQRVLAFCEKAAKITQIQRADHPVKHGVIVFGGDMVEGLFNFPTQPFEIDATLFEQYVAVSRLLVDVVEYALRVYETVQVVSEWGNHGRIGSKRDAVPRADNVDRMCFELARQLLDGRYPKRLVWEDCADDVQRLVVGNYRALVIHGDEFGRGGFAAPNTIVRHADRWASGAMRVDGVAWPFTDVYVHHYHTHQEHPMANGLGAVFFTGSTESDNRYARDGMSASATPSQRLHFIDPGKGRVTSQYRITLD